MTQPYADWVVDRYCRNKRRHASKLAANAAVLAHWARDQWAAAYPCEHCDGFHVTTDETREPA